MHDLKQASELVQMQFVVKKDIIFSPNTSPLKFQFNNLFQRSIYVENNQENFIFKWYINVSPTELVLLGIKAEVNLKNMIKINTTPSKNF